MYEYLVDNYFENHTLAEYSETVHTLRKQIITLDKALELNSLDGYKAYLKTRPVLTVHEAAVYLGVDEVTMRNIMKKSDFPAITRYKYDIQKRKYIDRKKFDEWIAEQHNQADDNTRKGR